MESIDWKHRLPGGLLGGRIVSVDDVERGDKCGCVCPACKTPLRANHGEKNCHYFSHQPMGEKTCGGAFESTVHHLAKQIIEEKGSLCIPPVIVEYSNVTTVNDPRLYRYGQKHSYESEKFKVFKIKDIVLESPLSKNINIIPDIQGNIDGIPLLIEIAVTHFVDDDKKNKIKESGLRCIEIDLSSIHRKDTDLSVIYQKIERLISSGTRTSWIFSPRKKTLIEQLQKEIDEEIQKHPLTKAKKNLDKIVEIIKKLAAQVPSEDDREITQREVTHILWMFGERWREMYDFILYSMDTRSVLDCKTILKESGIKIIEEASQALNDKKNKTIGFEYLDQNYPQIRIYLQHPLGAINTILRSFADGPDGIYDPAPLYEGIDKDSFPIFIVREEMRYDPIHPENKKNDINDFNKYLISLFTGEYKFREFQEFELTVAITLANRIVDEGIPSSVNGAIRNHLVTRMCGWDRERLNGIVGSRSLYRNRNPVYSVSKIMVRNASLEIFLNIPPKNKKIRDDQFTNMMARSLRISPPGTNKPFPECFEIVRNLEFRHCYLAEINGFLALAVEYGVSERKEGYIIQKISVSPFIEKYGRLPNESEVKEMITKTGRLLDAFSLPSRADTGECT